MMSFWNREAKPRQGGADISMRDLFRLSERTIASMFGEHSNFGIELHQRPALTLQNKLLVVLAR